MFRISLYTIILTLVVSIPSIQLSGCSAESKSEAMAQTDYWVPRNPHRAHYKIECSIDPAKGLLQGTEVINFKNTSSRPIHRLQIEWLSDNERLLKIMSKSKPVSILAETKEGDRYIKILFKLPDPIYPGEQANLELAFGGIKFSQSVSNREGFAHCVGWYPRLCCGFETHSDFDVSVKASGEYKIVTSGTLDTETGFYHAEGLRSFGLLLTKEFDVIEANAEDVLVSCVFPQKSKKTAQLLLSTAVDVINFYRERFGVYPYSSLTMVPGVNYPTTGGCPVATNIVEIHAMEQTDNLSESHWRWITAHEIGHQYWGEYVIEKDAPGWLWIGLGMYADREYTRTKGVFPKSHRSGSMNRYIQGVRNGFDTTINRTPEELAKVKFDFNNVVTHGKGYSVISALDCVLGRSVFERIYKRCLKDFGGKRLGVYEFRAVCEEESGQDLGWFFEQWVNSNRYLSYEIASKSCEKKGDRFISTVEVKCLGDLRMPVPVAAYFEDGSSEVKFMDRLLETDVLEFASKSPLKKAKLDPEVKLAMVIPPLTPNEAQLKEMVRVLPWTNAGKKALDVFKKAKEDKMINSNSWFKLGLTLYDGHYYEEALVAFRHTHESAEKTSNRCLASLVWQGHVLDLLGRRQEALDYYERVLKASKNLGMRHDQYGIEINRDWVKERIKKPFER
ncbi:MAG: M1 family aminopeptidase [Planctomycetota bacterium]|jgi:tetratricopeptide (TPR) repeat protein